MQIPNEDRLNLVASLVKFFDDKTDDYDKEYLKEKVFWILRNQCFYCGGTGLYIYDEQVGEESCWVCHGSGERIKVGEGEQASK